MQSLTRFLRRVTPKANYSKFSFLIILAVVSFYGVVPLSKTYFLPLEQYEQQVQGGWSEEKMSRTLDEERRRVRTALRNFSFPAGPIKSVSQLLPEEGGRQLITVIVSNWRSGSTFLGDTFNSHPATVYFYEPFKLYRARQIRAPPFSEESFHLLTQLFNNNYTDIDSYLKFEKSRNSYIKKKNIPLHRVCLHEGIKCFDPQFLSRLTRLYPFLVLKLTRLRLSLLEQFLDNRRYNIRVILLVRDPRGIMTSRHRHLWCQKNPDCFDPINLCSDLVADYATAIRFSQRFPNRFMVLRYEDLSLNPIEKTRELYSFTGLKLHRNVKKFLITHTKFKAGGEYTTFRNSTANAFAWRNKKPEQILEIQSYCEIALQLWGYRIIRNFTNIQDFSPMRSPFTVTRRFRPECNCD